MASDAATASTELLSDAATASRSSSSLAASWRPRASMPTTRPSGDRACLSVCLTAAFEVLVRAARPMVSSRRLRLAVLWPNGRV